MKATLFDRLEIQDLLQRFFHAMDAKASDLMSDCLHEEFSIELNLDEPLRVHGREQWLQTFQRLVAGMTASNHSISNCHIEVRGDRATSSMNAIARVRLGEVMRIRGIRYEDKLVRGADQWLMSRRKHMPLWQYQVAATALDLGLPAERAKG